MWFCLSDRIPLAYTVKFLKKHTLQWLCSKVEKNGPCLCDSLLVDVNEVKLVNVAVNKQVFVFLIHLGKLFVSVLQVLKIFLVLWLRSFALVAFASTLLQQNWRITVATCFFVFFLDVYDFDFSRVNTLTFFVFFNVRQGSRIWLEVSVAHSLRFFTDFPSSVVNRLFVVSFYRCRNLLEKAELKLLISF